MHRILFVQSRTDPTRVERERDNFRRAIGEAAEIDFLSALDEKLAWTSPNEFLKDCNGVIFGGSSDFDFDGGRDAKDPARLMSMIILSRTKMMVRYALAERVPVLGVCFGHQIIAQMHGGGVHRDLTQGKFGAHEVHLTEAGERDPLFSRLPKSFIAQYAHKDSAKTLPEGATLLATGESCRFSALRYGDRAYTMQFHPEIERMTGASEGSPDAYLLLVHWLDAVVSMKS